MSFMKIPYFSCVIMALDEVVIMICIIKYKSYEIIEIHIKPKRSRNFFFNWSIIIQCALTLNMVQYWNYNIQRKIWYKMICHRTIHGFKSYTNLNARYRCCDIQKCLKRNDVLHNSVISFCLENEVKIGPFN